MDEIKSIFKEFTEGDNLAKARILSKDVKNIANRIKNDRKPSKHQIRKYYHYFLDIYEEISNPEDFEKKLPKIALANSYISYDFSRNNTERTFKSFIENFVNAVLESGNKEKFKEMLMLFEALVGYSS